MKYRTIILAVIFCAKISFGQVGPGGVGNATSNGLWLKADDIEQSNNTPLVTWLDASGNGNNANQAATALQPAYFEISNINSMPIVRLDGANDEMAVADSPILDGTVGLTFYTVLRPNNLNGTPRGILGKRITFSDPSEYAYTWFFHTGNRLNLDVNTNNNRFNTGTTTFSNFTNYMLSWDFDGTLSSPLRSGISSESTNVLRATESSTVVSTSNQDLAIGALNVGYGTYLGADFAEIIHFNYALDAVDHILVQNYLSAKYNIALSANDLYDKDNLANGDYDFDVAGIGQLSATEVNADAKGSGIVRMHSPTDLNDNEFLIWGHDGGKQEATEIVDVPAGVEGRFERVWRVSEVNTSNASVNVGAVNIQFDLTGLGGVTPSDLRLLVDADNDGVFSDEIGISGATAIGSNVYQFAGVTAIANDLRFTLATINLIQTPLPIELLHFKATLSDNGYVKLDWQTASEVNNDYFTIERSQDGVSWRDVKKITGAGNSSVTLNYSAFDETPNRGISYYRLKQTDFNGGYSYSNIRTIVVGDFTGKTVKVYPNPALNQMVIQGDKTELEGFQIYNLLQQNVTALTAIMDENETRLVLDLSHLTTGVYWIKTKTTTTKIIKE